MPTDELRRRVHNDVRAVLNGTQEIRRRKGIVDDDGHALGVCDLCNRLDVDEVGVRVADRLDEDALRIRPYRIRKALRTCLRIDKRHVDSPLLHRMREEIVGAAIDGLLRDDVVALMSKCLKGRRNCRCPRGKGERRRAALKRCDALLEHVLRRVHEPPVDIAGFLEGKTVGRVLRVVKHIGSCLIDRHGTRIGHGIGLLLTDTHLQGFKTVLLFAHNTSSFPITHT